MDDESKGTAATEAIVKELQSKGHAVRYGEHSISNAPYIPAPDAFLKIDWRPGLLSLQIFALLQFFDPFLLLSGAIVEVCVLLLVCPQICSHIWLVGLKGTLLKLFLFLVYFCQCKVRIHVRRKGQGRGLSSAVLLGFQMAKHPNVLCMDADLQVLGGWVFVLRVVSSTNPSLTETPATYH